MSHRLHLLSWHTAQGHWRPRLEGGYPPCHCQSCRGWSGQGSLSRISLGIMLTHWPCMRSCHSPVNNATIITVFQNKMTYLNQYWPRISHQAFSQWLCESPLPQKHCTCEPLGRWEGSTMVCICLKCWAGTAHKTCYTPTCMHSVLKNCETCS